MAQLNGIDVSHWNTIDVSKSGKDFVIAKATQGTNMVDSACDNFIQSAKKAGMKYGVYHFWDEGTGSGTAQADYFLKNIDGYIGDAILALDFEPYGSNNMKNVSGAKEFLDRVYSKTGIKPVFYTNPSVLSGADFSSISGADYGLWLAKWGDSPGTPTDGWKNITLWQNTDNLSIQGQRVDGDIFYGDKSTWDAYAGKKSGPTPEDKPEPPKPSYSQIATDGKWGTDTTKRAQQFFGTPVDGKVSSQEDAWKSQNPGLTSGWDWVSGTPKGSQLIVAMQKKLGITTDGILGPDFVKHLEKHYGFSQDGHLDLPSATIKAFQNALNKNTF